MTGTAIPPCGPMLSPLPPAPLRRCLRRSRIRMSEALRYSAEGPSAGDGCEPPEHGKAAEVRAAGLSWLVSNALIASVPGHSFWDRVFRQLLDSRLSRSALEATGPIMLTRAYESFAGRSSICLLDSQIFSPLTHADAECGQWLEPAFRERFTGRAWAVRHWSNTWVRRSSRFPPLDECSVHLLRNRRVVMAGRAAHECSQQDRQHARGTIDLVSDGHAWAGGSRRGCHPVVSNQTYGDRELVILDDGDDSELETLVIALADPAIRYLRLEPLGLSWASCATRPWKRREANTSPSGTMMTFLTRADSNCRWRPCGPWVPTPPSCCAR